MRRAVGRPSPRPDAALLLRELFGLRRVEAVHRQAVQLLLTGLAAPVSEPLAVLAEREGRDAFLRVGDLAGLAAVGSHQVELVLVCGGRGRLAVGGEHEGRTVAQPGGVGLVLVLGERHLPGGRQALLHRHQVDVALALGLLPVRCADGVEQPAAVGAERRGAGRPHLLHVEERHRALRARLRQRLAGKEEQRGTGKNGATGK